MAVSEVLEKYVAALNSGDADRVAQLFAQECDFVDGVRNAFKGVFEAYSVDAKIVKLNPNSMEYDVTLAGLFIPCIGAATCDEDGLIKEYIVRPR